MKKKNKKKRDQGTEKEILTSIIVGYFFDLTMKKKTVIKGKWCCISGHSFNARYQKHLDIKESSVIKRFLLNNPKICNQFFGFSHVNNTTMHFWAEGMYCLIATI